MASITVAAVAACGAAISAAAAINMWRIITLPERVPRGVAVTRARAAATRRRDTAAVGEWRVGGGWFTMINFFVPVEPLPSIVTLTRNEGER
ncbi:hypothetical protein [Sphingomonas sp. DT-51]|uniref:hypothetical protein n=1 Tax=Sphingomonas sp. DT-51 TaxID=3396165 RepID=UPI003F54128B